MKTVRMQMRKFPAKGRPASAWKNGKGITREVAIYPSAAGLDNFDWRVSLAEVTQSSSFSSFPGVDRALAVLNGTLLLRIGTQPVAALSPDSRPASFRGDEPCHAEVEGHVVQDLNVMTRQGRFSSLLTLVEPCGPIAILMKADATMIIALDDLVVEIDHSETVLGPLDAALFEAPSKGASWQHCRIRPSSTRAAMRLYVIDLIAFAPPQDVLALDRK